MPWYSKQKEAEEALQRLNTELRDLSKHLQYVRETEKNKLAKEMLDELGQGLASLKLNVSWIKKHLGDDTLILEMEDNGDGYGISNIDNKIHYGTLEMRERVYALKGRFNRKYIAGKGIFTGIQVPLN